MEEQGFLLWLHRCSGDIPQKVIVAKDRDEAIKIIKGLPGYRVGPKEISFYGRYQLSTCRLSEISIVRAGEKALVS